MFVTTNMVTGVPNIVPPDGVCRVCILGKHNHEPFDSWKTWHAHNQLELVHNDLCCMNKPSLEYVKYILMFI